MFHRYKYFQVLNVGEARNQSADVVQPLAGDASMEKELEHFRMVVLIIHVQMISVVTSFLFSGK